MQETLKSLRHRPGWNAFALLVQFGKYCLAAFEKERGMCLWGVK